MIEEKKALLVKSLHDTNSSIRRDAVNAIREMNDPEGLDLIIELLENEKDEDVVHDILYAFTAYGNDTRVIDILIHIAFSEPNVSLRWNAVGALGDIANPIAAEPLLRLLQIENTPESEISRKIAQVLGRIGDVRALPALRALVESPDMITDGVVGLSYFTDTESIPLLIKVLKDADREDTDLMLYGYYGLTMRTGLSDTEISDLLNYSSLRNQ